MNLDTEEKLKIFKNKVNVFKDKFFTRGSPANQTLSKQAPVKILIDITSGIAVGGFLGYIIDDYLGTLPLMLFILIICGMIGGIYNVYKNTNEDAKRGKD